MNDAQQLSKLMDHANQDLFDEKQANECNSACALAIFKDNRGVWRIVMPKSRAGVNRKGKAYGNVWNLPGGRQDPGESLLDTAIRETSEETDWSLILHSKWLRKRIIVRTTAFFLFVVPPKIGWGAKVAKCKNREMSFVEVPRLSKFLECLKTGPDSILRCDNHRYRIRRCTYTHLA
jgi:8-oxo-dGTP pyrophosphatase MutT (NUDIX family)